MPELILVLSDLYPASLSDGVRATLPRLERLEQWLARGAKERITEGWRGWLRRRTHDPALMRTSPAAIAAAAVPAAGATGSTCFATPVHLVAGLDTVRLHPAGVLGLELEAQQTLERDFARTFEGSGYALHATGRRELLLSGAPLTDAHTASNDPAAWAGRDPRSGLASGQSAAVMLRLGAEIEMWLYEHPLNQARQARGLLTVSGLWLWGGGSAPIVRAAHPVPEDGVAAVAWADDLFMDGLAKLSGATLRPLPPRWPAAELHPRSKAAEFVVVCGLGADAGRGALERLEHDWIAPAFDQWRSGEIPRATLLAGDLAVSLVRAPLRRLWSAFSPKPHPWWESWPAC